MSASHIPSFLMVFFSITTAVVFFYPIIKLTPSWLERSMAKTIILHRHSLAALDAALERSDNDAELTARLRAQHDYHQAALQTLVPGEVAPAAPAPRIDAAA